jgi:hypothetical protein
MEAEDAAQIEAVLKANFTYKDRPKIDSNGFVTVGRCRLLKPQTVLPVKFAKSGNFSCEERGLTSLEGAPKIVNGDFDCSNNALTSLKYGPKKVNYDYRCGHNRLTSLVGLPDGFTNQLYCDHNNLNSLQGLPENFDGTISCVNNPLTSFEGLPIGTRFITFSYSADLPFLRLLTLIRSKTRRSMWSGNEKIDAIIHKYFGNNSRSAILKCQKELIDAGFEGNAAW